MNQKPSQLRLVLSWSHFVASRISGLAVRGCSAMSAFDEIPQLAMPSSQVHALETQAMSSIGRTASCLQPAQLYSTIDTLQLPLAVRDRTLGVLGAGAVVGEHVDHEEVRNHGRRLLAHRADAGSGKRSL